MTTKLKIDKVNMYNDYLFKSFIRSIEARDIVSSFLSSLTGIDKDKLYNASYQGGEITKIEKGKSSDIIVKIDDNNHIIIEMNQYDTPHLINKNVDYAFSDIVQSIRPNNKFVKVYLINIDKFNKFKRKDPILYFGLRNKYGDIESEMYQSIHIVIDNFVNQEYNISEEVNKFISLLKMKSIDEMKDKFKNEEMYLKAIEKVEKYMENEEFIGLYDTEERRKWEMNEMKLAGFEQGIEQGIEKGIEQGIESRNIELAKSLPDYYNRAIKTLEEQPEDSILVKIDAISYVKKIENLRKK